MQSEHSELMATVVASEWETESAMVLVMVPATVLEPYECRPASVLLVREKGT
jgi:hypothetical protein